MAKSTVVLTLDTVVNGQHQVVEATANYRDLAQAFREAQAEMKKNQFGAVVKDCAALGLAFQSLEQGISGLASTYNSFDKSMRAVNTMAGKNAEGMALMKEQVKELAATVPLAREELANGLYQTISNGVPEDNWVSFLEKSAKSAVGGMADLNGVVTVTATVIKNYGLAWEEAGAIQDKIQTTAKNGVTSFEQMQEALPKVTGNAASLGVSIDELMASFATLTGVSGNTAEVATQLSAIFTALVKPASKAAKMAEEMGISFNAASIKAAGGFRNFLTQLDRDVKRYAATSGMLEQEIYARLFGSAESLRALIPLTGELADKYTENVAAMADSTGAIDAAFEEMSGSADSNARRIGNLIANYTDLAGSIASTIQPYLQYIATAGMALSGITATTAAVGKLGKGYVALCGSLAKATGLSKGIDAAMRSLTASTTMSATAVRTLGAALKTALISSGIGTAIWAISAAIGYFTNKSDEAARKQKEMAEAAEEFRKKALDISEATSRYADGEIAKLDRLYKVATDESRSRKERTEAMRELQKLYPDYFGKLSAENNKVGELVQQYQKLRTSILESARSRAIFDKIAENSGHQLTLEENINEKETRLGELNAEQSKLHRIADNNTGKIREAALLRLKKNRKELAAINKELAPLQKEYDDYERANKALEEKLAQVSKEPVAIPGATTNSGGTDKGKKGKVPQYHEVITSLQDINDNIEYYEALQKKASEQDAKVFQARIDALQKQKAAWTNVTKPLHDEITCLQDIDDNIAIYRELQKKASAEEYAGYQKNIDALQKQRDEWTRSLTPLHEEITCLKDIEDNIAHYRELRERASAEEYAGYQKNIDALQKQRDEWGKVAPKAIEHLHTIREIEEALSYYRDLQQTQSADEILATQATIDALEQKNKALQRGITLQQSAREIADKTAQRGNFGDIRGAQTQIGALGKQLGDTENPVSEAQAEAIRQQIRALDDWQKACAKSFSTVQTGWNAIVGLNSAFNALSDAITSDATAWDRLIAIVSAAMEIMAAISSVVDFLKTLNIALTSANELQTAATTKLAVSKTADASASVEEAGAAAASTAASVAQTVANHAETSSWMALVAAKVAAANASAGWAGIPMAAAQIGAYSGMVATAGAVSLFAKGGIVTGPTLGIMGEYPNAGSNPEVIAPLDKLRNLLNDSGMGGGEVVFKLRGDELEGVLRRRNSKLSRNGL